MGRKLDAAEKTGMVAIATVGVIDRLLTRWKLWRADRAADQLAAAVAKSKATEAALIKRMQSDLAKLPAWERRMDAIFAKNAAELKRWGLKPDPVEEQTEPGRRIKPPPVPPPPPW